MNDLTLIATCAFGLESEVSYELRRLGYEEQEKRVGRVLFKSDFAGMARANIWLRTAERVLWSIGEFEAMSFDELYNKVKALPWGDILPGDAEFPVDGNSVSSQLSSVPAIQRITKKAIVDAMAAKYKRQTLPETGVRHRIKVSLLKDVATLTLDTSGDGLHKRGYRNLSHEAPLKETMAAALVLFSRWRPHRPFADPFCGSGTIAIEAAMIGRSIAPGIRREFAAEQWPVVPFDVWKAARNEANDKWLRGKKMQIFASDISSKAIDLSDNHAKRAGVADTITLARKDIADFMVAPEYGALVTNPPYGDRIGELEEVVEHTKALAQVFRRHPTWSFFVFTAFERFERNAKKRATRKRKLYNGRIRCDLYHYLGPRPPAPEAVSQPSIGEQSGKLGGSHSAPAHNPKELERIVKKLEETPRQQLKKLSLPSQVTKHLYALLGASDETKREELRQEIKDELAEIDQATLRAIVPLAKKHKETEEQVHARLERWRDGLIAGEASFLKAILEARPNARAPHMKKLAAKAKEEQEKELPPRATRKLFRYLRSLES